MSGPRNRIEYAKSGRAVCQNGECKKRGLKIEKGALRQGVWVSINGNESWKWRHFGCITDRVMKTMHEHYGADAIEKLDGCDELEEKDQQKVKLAIEKGVIEPEDRTTWEPYEHPDGGYDEVKDLNLPAGSPKKPKEAPKRKRKSKKGADDDDSMASDADMEKHVLAVDSDEDAAKPKAKATKKARNAVKDEPEEGQVKAETVKEDLDEAETKEEAKDDKKTVKATKKEKKKSSTKSRKKAKLESSSDVEADASEKKSSKKSSKTTSEPTRKAPRRGARKAAIQEASTDEEDAES